jgi:hypothetical protein
MAPDRLPNRLRSGRKSGEYQEERRRDAAADENTRYDQVFTAPLFFRSVSVPAYIMSRKHIKAGELIARVVMDAMADSVRRKTIMPECGKMGILCEMAGKIYSCDAPCCPQVLNSLPTGLQ